MKKTENVILKVYKYFLPSAWKKYKGYFVVRFLRLVVTTIMPFIPILLMPRIVDELLGARDVSKLWTYVIIIIGAEFILSLLNGLFGNLIERYAVKFENYYKQIMSTRIMELDFQLTEDKKALEQMELAKNGMTWYSGGLNGIVEPLFNMASALFTLLVVQFVKEPLDRFVKLPTAFVAYLVALVTLIVATWMTKGMDAQELLLCLFNALLAATSAMGMYEKTFAKANKTEY